MGSYAAVDAVTKKGKPNSDGGTGWIKSLNDDGTYDVEYIVPKKVSKHVDPSRIQLNGTDGNASRRS